MNVGSLFSGIGGLDEGLRRAGHRHVFFCESDAYRRDVLRTRFPGVPVYEDVRLVGEPATRAATDGCGAESVESGGQAWAGIPGGGDVGLLCGGFPCQDLSVAGRRAGLAGNRSGLFFEFARIIESLRPGWLLIENVPGLLSSNGGRDFGVVLGTLADLGYGVAWRILDSRFFGVPQRRRRVFIVGAVADGDPRAAAERAGEVLAVGQGCVRHLAPRREKGQDAPVASLSGLGSGGPDDNDGQGGRLVADTLREHPRPGSNSNGQIAVSGTLKSQRGKGGGGIGPEETLVAGSLPTSSRIAEDIAPTLQAAKSEARGGTDGPLVAAPLTKGSATGEGVNQPGRRQEDDVNLVPIAGPLGGGNDGIGRRTEDDPNLVTAFSWQQGDDSKFNPDGRGRSWVARAGDYAAGLSASGRHDAISGESVGVRRLTPTECERLQGFPDGWTQLGKTPDSRRYSALGDAVTVNVAEWIGSRLAEHGQAETGVDSQPPTRPQGDTSRRKEDATP